MNSHRLITAFASSLALLALAPAAQAVSLPKFSDKEIVINKSLAGVKLGGSPESGKKAWGKKGADCFPNHCQWRISRQDISAGEANFSFNNDGKITAIVLYASFNAKGKIDIRKWIQVPKTSKGIGIGSTRKQLKKAYPKAKDLDDGFTFSIKKGERETLFGIDKESKRIRHISITMPGFTG